MSDTPETDAFIEALNDDWDYEFAALTAHAKKLERERDEARVQYRTTEALGMALVKTIGELRAEKAELFVQVVNLQAGGRRATLDEIAESVREKYEPEHEGECIEN
jgi:cell division protein FtsB